MLATIKKKDSVSEYEDFILGLDLFTNLSNACIFKRIPKVKFVLQEANTALFLQASDLNAKRQNIFQNIPIPGGLGRNNIIEMDMWCFPFVKKRELISIDYSKK